MRRENVIHGILLLLFAGGMFLLWMLPVFLMGYPSTLSDIVLSARTLAETGVLDNTTLRLLAIIVWSLHPFISWDNVVAWTGVSAAGMALALLPWWWCVRRLFDVRIAWLSTVVLALIPLYWIEALDLGGYTFALFFLFLGFAFFLKFYPRHRLLAVMLFGVCFGAVLASRDAFIPFLPWLVIAYFWIHRRQWMRALLEIAVFCMVAYVAFALPLLPNALLPGMTPVERVQVFLPSLKSTVPGEGHLYPDAFIFTRYRAEYNQQIEARVQGESFLASQGDRHYRFIFGVGGMGFFDGILTGTWLFLNNIPALFLQETVGGAFLWLFILPGIFVLWKERRWLLFLMTGLWLSIEVLVRYVLHFGRLHVNDFGWMLALLAGVGAVAIIARCAHGWTQRRTVLLGFVIALLVAGQLVQANRKILATMYARSTVPMTYAVGEELTSIPADAVIGHPRRREYFFFARQRIATIHPITVDFLAARGKLAEPFKEYGVTHILGYDEAQTRLITKAVPSIKVIPLPQPAAIHTTPLVQYLLHLVR